MGGPPRGVCRGAELAVLGPDALAVHLPEPTQETVSVPGAVSDRSLRHRTAIAALAVPSARRRAVRPSVTGLPLTCPLVVYGDPTGSRSVTHRVTTIAVPDPTATAATALAPPLDAPAGAPRAGEPDHRIGRFRLDRSTVAVAGVGVWGAHTKVGGVRHTIARGFHLPGSGLFAQATLAAVRGSPRGWGSSVPRINGGAADGCDRCVSGFRPLGGRRSG